MNILFVARAYPPTTGGMERLAYDLYSNLSQIENVTLVRWPYKNRKILVPVILVKLFFESIYKLVTREVDVIHVQDGLQAPLGMILKLVFHKPLTVVIHGLDITYKNSLYQKIIPRALARADTIFCISDAARAEVIRRGIKKERTVVAPVGITDDLFLSHRSSSKQKLSSLIAENLGNRQILLTVGRLVERKGVDWFVDEVMPKLIKAHPDICYLVAGEGPMRSQIEANIEKNKLSSNVFLLGRVSDEMIKYLYNSADIFVMPNIPIKGDMEGFGRVLLEASACQLPVVASGIEGIKDAITNGHNGVLVSPKGTQAYVRVIFNWLEKDSESMRFGKSSRKYTLERYGWEEVIKIYTAAYHRLADRDT